MTWKQFKDAVEQNGAEDTDEVVWIDVGSDYIAVFRIPSRDDRKLYELRICDE